jgi:chitinase
MTVHMRKRFVVILTIFSLPLFSAMAQDSTQTAAPDYHVVGYFASYDIYDQQYFVTDIGAGMLTDINYGPIDISENGQCVSSDLWADTQYSYPDDERGERLRGNVKQLQLLRGDYPNLKIIMSIGGWDFSTNFSAVAFSEDSRTRFVNSCIALMRQYQFDGIDLDWRYPVEGGLVSSENEEDAHNLTLLLQEFRAQLDGAGVDDAQTYLLTLTAPAVETFYRNYELGNVHLFVDWINLTTYGYQGEWSEIASHQAPLSPNTSDPRGEPMTTEYNVESSVNAYLDAGVPANKIVIGIPFFAQTWRNVRAGDLFGLYQPADGVPTGTHSGGLLYFRDMEPLIDSDSYTRYFDNEVHAPWLYNASTRIAVSYEDQESIGYKTLYVRTQGLGGVLAWELSYDDDEHTLLNAVHEGLFTP